MLVVMHDRNVKLFSQPSFNVKTAWCADVLQIDPAEAWREALNNLDDGIRVLCAQTDGPRIDAGELFEKHGLALHDGQGSFRPQIPQAEHR